MPRKRVGHSSHSHRQANRYSSARSDGPYLFAKHDCWQATRRLRLLFATTMVLGPVDGFGPQCCYRPWADLPGSIRGFDASSLGRGSRGIPGLEKGKDEGRIVSYRFPERSGSGWRPHRIAASAGSGTTQLLAQIRLAGILIHSIPTTRNQPPPSGIGQGPRSARCSP